MPPAGERPLRVCYLVSYFHPFASGAERQALAQGVELARRGHQVRVITREVAGYPIDDEEYQGVQIHRWIRTSQHGPLFGLSYVHSTFRALRALRGEIDLIHTHQGLWEAAATGFASIRGLKIPTLIQPASSGYYGEAQELHRTRGTSILRKLILKNTAFAAISEEIEREWLAVGVPASRLFRAASGVDTDRFQPGPSAVEEALLPRPRVMFTGRLHPQKNLPLLLNAWVQVARQSSANLILVGPGPDREPLQSLAKQLGIADRVQFVGPVADPSDHLRAADLFTLPSVAEGMSNSLLEAMAAALPCVVSGIGGNIDLITDRVNGRLVAGTDPDSWAKAYLELLEDPAEAARLGQRARELVESRYSIRAVVDRYLDLYHEMIAGRWLRRV